MLIMIEAHPHLWPYVSWIHRWSHKVPVILKALTCRDVIICKHYYYTSVTAWFSNYGMTFNTVPLSRTLSPALQAVSHRCQHPLQDTPHRSGRTDPPAKDVTVRVRLSVSTVNRTHELSGVTHVTPFREYGKHSIGPSTYGPWVRTYSKPFSCKSVRRAQSNEICTCHVGLFRESLGTDCCTCGQSNTTNDLRLGHVTLAAISGPLSWGPS